MGGGIYAPFGRRHQTLQLGIDRTQPGGDRFQRVCLAFDQLTDGADLVIVHEWNEPNVVSELGSLRRLGAPFTLLFHDTHHRAVSEPEAMKAYDLDGYDGVLAFGETLSEVYRGWGWQGRVWTWHEAADIRHFHPPAQEQDRQGLVWIGNWGDGERTEELESFLFRFFQLSQFKRSAVPNGPKVSSGGALSPRGDWRAPSDASADVWLAELRDNVPA